MRLTIVGAPRTKKTSSRIIGSGPKCNACGKRTGRPFLIPSEENVAWTKDAVRQLREQLAGRAGFTVPVNCRILIYRDRAVGDAVNFFQASADALETAKVVENDRLIVSWDGSRLLKDAGNPRVEILLSPVDDSEHAVVRRWRPRGEQSSLALPAPSPLDDDDVPIS